MNSFVDAIRISVCLSDMLVHVLAVVCLADAVNALSSCQCKVELILHQYFAVSRIALFSMATQPQRKLPAGTNLVEMTDKANEASSSKYTHSSL